jgi:ferredoxin
MMFDFGFFREQMCTLVCPYARLQSALLDRDSVVIGYDGKRGEPRGKRSKGEDSGHGDCIDCKLCVAACPTGIDIRDGLQLECIACAQCIDACDAVMDKIEKPRGLIRYSSQNALAGLPSKLVRPRTMVYPAIVMLTSTALILGLAGRDSAEVNLLRVQGQPWRVQEETILNPLQIRIDNKADEARSYSVEVLPPTVLSTSQFPLTVPSREGRSVVLLLTTPRSAFEQGQARVRLVVSDGVDFEQELDHPSWARWTGGRDDEGRHPVDVDARRAPDRDRGLRRLAGAGGARRPAPCRGRDALQGRPGLGPAPGGPRRARRPRLELQPGRGGGRRPAPDPGRRRWHAAHRPRRHCLRLP